MKKILALLGISQLLFACIIVDDFGTTWEEAAFDPCISKAAKRVSEFDLPDEPGEELVRWIALDDVFNVMLVKEKSDARGGHAYLYQLDGNVLSILTPDKSTRVRFERTYPDAPAQIDEDTITVSSLEPATMDFIKEVAYKPEYWTVLDSKLYNTRRLEACSQHIPDDE